MMMDELCAMDASSRIRLSPCHYTTLLDLPDTGPVRSRRTACLLKAMALLLLVAGAVGHHTLHSSPPLATHALMSHALPVQPPLALGTTPPAAATGTRLSRPLLRSPHAPGRHSALDPLYIASRDDPDAFRPLSSAGLSRVLWGVGLVLCGFFLVIRGSRWAMATFTSEQFPNQGPKWRRTRKYYPELPLAPGEHSWRRSYFFRKRMKWTDPGMIAYEYRGIKCRHCGLRLYEPGPFTKQEVLCAPGRLGNCSLRGLGSMGGWHRGLAKEGGGVVGLSEDQQWLPPPPPPLTLPLGWE